MLAKRNHWLTNSLRVMNLVLAAAFITYGIIAGEPEAVLRKAVQICLECIGIG